MTPAPGDEHIGLSSSSYQFATHRWPASSGLPPQARTGLTWGQVDYDAELPTRGRLLGRSGPASPPDDADFPDSIPGAIRSGKSSRRRRFPRLDPWGDQVRQVLPTTPISQTRSLGRSGPASPPDDADFPDSIPGAIRSGKSSRRRRFPRLDPWGDQVRPTQPHETALASYARLPDPYRFEGNRVALSPRLLDRYGRFRGTPGRRAETGAGR